MNPVAILHGSMIAYGVCLVSFLMYLAVQKWMNTPSKPRNRNRWRDLEYRAGRLWSFVWVAVLRPLARLIDVIKALVKPLPKFHERIKKAGIRLWCLINDELDCGRPRREWKHKQKYPLTDFLQDIADDFGRAFLGLFYVGWFLGCLILSFLTGTGLLVWWVWVR